MENTNNGSELQLDKKKSIWAWSFYDWANSAFATTVMAGFFPVFLTEYWAAGVDGELVSLYLGTANSVASLLVALLAPILGAFADNMGNKKKLLTFFAFIGILTTGSLMIVMQGQWQLAVFLYIMGTIGFSGANIFYDSLLPGVASEKKIDYVSSLGFSIGYIGGGLLFAVNVLMFMMPEMFGIATGERAIQISFLSVAIWWAVFSIPILLFVKEPEAPEKISAKIAMKRGYSQLKDTIKDIRHLKYVGLFLAAFWLYIDGVDTIIRMAVDYGLSIGFQSQDLIIVLLIVQFVAFPGTLLYNAFAAKIGIKKGILVAIGAYMVITLFGVFMNQTWHFYALGILIGCFQGGIQALSRSLYSRLIPENKAAQFYGLYNMLGKFAAIIGPILMTGVGYLTDDPRMGILSILLLFIPGFLLLWKVDIDKGQQMAIEYLGKGTTSSDDESKVE